MNIRSLRSTCKKHADSNRHYYCAIHRFQLHGTFKEDPIFSAVLQRILETRFDALLPESASQTHNLTLTLTLTLTGTL